MGKITPEEIAMEDKQTVQLQQVSGLCLSIPVTLRSSSAAMLIWMGQVSTGTVLHR